MKKKLFLLFIFLFASCSPKLNQNNLKNQRSLFLKKSRLDKIYWQTWSQELLDKIKTQNKLIFLTIGYGNCFACDKMHKETFAKQDVADILNKNFISIKVDRDEHPDVDIHFLNLQTAIMKFGAWPINLILTPDLKPVFAMTFMSQREFTQLLNQVQIAWKSEPNKIKQQINQFLSQLKPVDNKSIQFNTDESLNDDFYKTYLARFDPIYGGIAVGSNFEPKFPNNEDLRLLIRYQFKNKNSKALEMVKKTVTAIANSALIDQIDGGIHRYSTSRDWSSPNFEKQLIDQASFLNMLNDLNAIEPNSQISYCINNLVNFLINKFHNPRGGFFTSQSSSLNETDGFYFTWQEHEIQSSMKPNYFSQFQKYFKLHAPQPQYQQRRSLSLKTFENNQDIEPILEVRNILQKSNHKKIKPEIDEKIITSQSAFALSALIKTAKILPSPNYIKIIEENLNALIQQNRHINGKLYRQSIGGETKHEAILDDYAFLVDSLIEFYQLTFEEKYLHLAVDIQEKQNNIFFNSAKNLYSFNADSKKYFDAQFIFKDLPYPSGQSISYWNLVRLSYYFPNKNFKKMAKNLVKSYPDQLKTDPLSFAHLLQAIDFETSNPQNIIIKGSQIDCQKESQIIYKKYFPYLLVSCAQPSSRLTIHKDQKNSQKGFVVCNSNSCLPEFDSIEDALKSVYSFEL
jgi:uncharacterized protein